MSNFLGDSFYVIEFLGHINNGSYTFKDLIFSNTKEDPSRQFITADSWEEAVAQKSLLLKIEEIKKIGKFGASEDNRILNRYGIVSMLPMGVGEKLTSVEVEESASVGIPKAYLKFEGCNYEDLKRTSIIDKKSTWKWHDKGSGFRVWIGHSIKDPNKIDEKEVYNVSCIFEGYVLEPTYEYLKNGIAVNLTLNSYKAAKATIPMEDETVWKSSATVMGLLTATCDILDIPESNILISMGIETQAKPLKDKLKVLLGIGKTGIHWEDLTKEEQDISLSFYNNSVLPKILDIRKSGFNPTPVQIFNLITRELGFLLRWHITTRGHLFFGIPNNPKTVDKNWLEKGMKFSPNWKNENFNKTTPECYPPRKFFSYRPLAATPFKVADYLNQEVIANTKTNLGDGYSDFYDNIALGEVERGALPIVEEVAFNTAGVIKEPGADGDDSVDQEIQSTDAQTGAYATALASNGSFQTQVKGGIGVKLDGYKDFPPGELVELVAESFTLGTVSCSVSGCIPDPHLTILDTFQLIGYYRHSGRYLVTSITYKFVSGERPSMDIRGIMPLNMSDFEEMNSGSIASLTANIGRVPKVDEAQAKEVLSIDPTTGAMAKGESYQGVMPANEAEESD